MILFFKSSAKELGTWLYFSTARQMGYYSNIEEKKLGAPIKRLFARFLKAGNIRPIKVSSRLRKYSFTVGALTPHSEAILL